MRKHAFMAIGFLLFLALYLPTLRFAFIDLDDGALVRYFHYYADVTNLRSVFRHSVMSAAHIDSGHFRPVLEAYWIVTSSISKAIRGAPDPAVYHAGTLLLHAIACTLLWRLLRRLGHAQASASMLTSAFAFHPAMATAVGWTCGCNESLFAIFALLTLTALHTLWQSEDAPRPVDLLACATCVFLMLCAKESTVLLLPVMLLFGPAAQRLRARVPPLLPLCAPALAWFVLRANALHGIPTAHELTTESIRQCVKAATQGIPMYFGKLMAPVNLAGMWPMDHPVTGYQAAATILAGLVLLALAPPRARLALTWFAACTCLTFIGTKDGVYILREDHIYTASLGCFIAVPPGLWEASAMPWRARVAGACAVLALLVVQTHTHLALFSSSERYFSNVTRHAPHLAEAHVRLADAYVGKQDLRAAMREYEQAAAINFAIPQVHNNMGVCLLRMNELERAHSEFTLETQLQPQWDVAWGNLGSVQAKLGQTAQAEQSLLRAVYLNRDNGQAFANLASLYAAQSNGPQLEAVLINLKRLELLD